MESRVLLTLLYDFMAPSYQEAARFGIVLERICRWKLPRVGVSRQAVYDINRAEAFKAMNND